MADTRATQKEQDRNQGVHAVRDAGEPTSGAFGRNASALADSQRRMSDEASDRIAETGQKAADLARTGAEDFRMLMMLPVNAGTGTHDLHRGATALLEGVLRTNMRLAEEMLRTANPMAMVDMQRRFINGYLAALMDGSVAMLRAVQQSSERSLQPLEAHLEQRRNRAAEAAGA